MSGRHDSSLNAGRARLGQVEAWVFDLDNTLYPASCDLFAQINRRINAFLSNFLGVDPAAAREVQQTYIQAHSSTLRGLMVEHGLDPEIFLDYVHAIDHSVLPESPALDRALGRIEGRKLIFTNASLSHAERVMERLGVRRHFQEVFDAAAAGYVPKPEPEAYERLVSRHRLEPRTTVLFEDIARHLKPAAALGMTTVWVRNGVDDAGADRDYIHHVADDLVAWLEAAAAERGGAGRLAPC